MVALATPWFALTASAQAEPAPTDPPAEPSPEPELPAAEAAPEAGPPTEAGAAEAQAAEDALGEIGDMEIGDVDAAAPPGEGELDEVVVTVDRRTKNLQKYSGTASAFSEAQLAAVGITNVRDLSTKVPGLQIGNQEGNTEVYIRGIGSDNNTELGDPAVALHLDGIYLPRPRGLGAMFFDIARVEVNSGPQGTLRGRNALGGSVNIVSNQPKLGEFEANAEAMFGTFAQRRYQGMVNIPLGDSFAFRAAAFSEVHDPWWENAGPLYDIKGPESIDSYAFRLQAKWQPVQAFSALVAFDYTRERGTGWLGANFQGPLTYTDDRGTADEGDDVPAPVAPEDIDNPRRIYNRGMQSWLDLKHHGTRLQLNYDAGPVQFEANGSYREMRFVQNNGGTAGLVWDGFGADENTPDNFGSSYWDQGSKSYIGELRAFAPESARFRWTIGGFYFYETQDTFLGQTGDNTQGFGGGIFPMPETKGDSIAGFADGTFDVTDTFRVLGGVRVTRENKERFGGLWALWTGWPSPGTNVRFGTEGFRYRGVDAGSLALPDNADVEDRVNLFLDQIDSFGARDTIQQYLCADPPAAAEGEDQQPRIAKDENGNWRCTNGVNPGLGEDGFGIQAVPQNNQVEATYFDWRAGLEFDLAEQSMLYATASTGHKAGGFNDTAQNAGLFNSEYGPEDVIAFELGSKNTLLDRRLRLNASAFFYHYNDMVFQTIVSVTPPDEDGMGGSNTAVRQNAASANIYGLDLDVTYSLPLGLEAEVHALLMDARFGDGTTVNDSRIGFDVPQYPVDISGNWLPRVSPITLNYNLSQLIFTSVGSFNWVISGQTRAQHYFTVFNGEGELLPALDGTVPTTDSYQALVDNPARLTDVIKGYTRFDAGLGWKHPDGRISINGFVNNVFNTTYATSIIATPGLNLRFFNPPRNVGVRFRVDW